MTTYDDGILKIIIITQFFLSSVPSLSFFLPHYHISQSLTPSPFPHSLLHFLTFLTPSSLSIFPHSRPFLHPSPSLLQSFIFSLPSVPHFIFHFLFAITPALSPSLIPFFPPSFIHFLSSLTPSLVFPSFHLFSWLPISLNNFPLLTLSKINLHANFMSS